MSENAQWTKDVKQRGLGAEGSQAGRPPTDVRNAHYFHKVVDCQWAVRPIRRFPNTSG